MSHNTTLSFAARQEISAAIFLFGKAMKQEQMQAACDLLYRNGQQETRIDELPPDLRPSDRSEGYGVQAFLENHSSQPLFGWKIAATSAPGQAHIGVDGPLAGRLLAERVIEDGGVCVLGNNLMKVAEVEFAFRMAGDLPPRDTPYTENEVLARVATLHPAIEIPDSRFNHFERAGLAQLVADNACAHRFVLGAATAADWRALDLAAQKPEAFLNGGFHSAGLGANVLGGPVIALTWLVNELSRHGLSLKAGQAVTTGTCVKPVAIAAGDHFAGDFGELGRVSASPS
jgi:2-keto-4-pentenoate hydratase